MSRALYKRTHKYEEIDRESGCYGMLNGIYIYEQPINPTFNDIGVVRAWGKLRDGMFAGR